MNTKPFALSNKHIVQLRGMLPRSKAEIDVPRLVARINKAAGRYVRVAARLGCKPYIEIWDRSLEDGRYAKKSMNEFARLSTKQMQVWSDRVDKMDRALYQLCTDLAECWLEITHGPLPQLPSARGKTAAAQRVAISQMHPFGLLLNGLGIRISSKTTAEIVKFGKLRAARPELKGIALK